MATQPLDVSIALLPDDSSEVAAYTLKDEFERTAKAEGMDVDLTVKLFDTYRGVNDLGRFDVAEVDLCMRDKLVDGAGQPNLDKIPPAVLVGRGWVPPVLAEISGTFEEFLVPHWIRMPLFVHRNNDVSLMQAVSFDEICATLEPIIDAAERYLYSDLWGDEPLGVAYVDAMIDLRGAPATAVHLRSLAASDDAPLDPEVVLAIWRISTEMRKELLAKRERLHLVPAAYARGFASNDGSAVYGPLSLIGAVDQYNFEEPWEGGTVPLDPTRILLRQMPFATPSATSSAPPSAGTPLRATAFVIPKDKLAAKAEAIKLLLDFLISEPGYRCFLKPKPEFPATYQVPAETNILFSSALVRTDMPLLLGLRTIADDGAGNTVITFPLFEGAFVISSFDLHVGLRKAGERLQPLLQSASV